MPINENSERNVNFHILVLRNPSNILSENSELVTNFVAFEKKTAVTSIKISNPQTYNSQKEFYVKKSCLLLTRWQTALRQFP